MKAGVCGSSLSISASLSPYCKGQALEIKGRVRARVSKRFMLPSQAKFKGSLLTTDAVIFHNLSEAVAVVQFVEYFFCDGSFELSLFVILQKFCAKGLGGWPGGRWQVRGGRQRSMLQMFSVGASFRIPCDGVIPESDSAVLLTLRVSLLCLPALTLHRATHWS